MRHVLNPIAAALMLTLGGGSPAVAQNVSQDVARQMDRIRTVVRTTAPMHSAGDGQSRDFKVEQRDTQTKTVAIGTQGDLTLKNISGDITVKAGGTKEATIEILRLSRGRTDADAKLGLERVTVDVTTRGERAEVVTRYPSERNPGYSVSVSYTVTAPAGTAVNVETISGRVRVTGLQGGVSARAISGTIDLMSCAKVAAAKTVSGTITLADAQSDGDLEVEAISGGIHLTNIKARRVTASVVSGTISARDVQADGASLDSISGNVEYSGSVTPKGRYEFKAHSGNVRVGVLGGFDLEASTFSGRVEADASLGIPPGTNPRSLRGVAGNGGASIVATTFSGNVWVGRKLN